jgi:antirestriction protein ArdC
LLNFLPNHPIPYYLSYKQAKELGGNVRKGAKAEKVYFFKAYHKDGDGKSVSEDRAAQLAGMGEEVHRIPFLKSFAVFNVADVERVDFEYPEVQLNHHKQIERCEQLIKQLTNPPQLATEDANRAWYNPRRDVLNMPELSQFSQAEEYYCTLFHELTHSTGHVTRLNREGIAGSIKPGSEEYAREELIAEMGASFLCAHTGIDVESVTTNSAAYLAGWLKRLQDDNKLVLKAAAGAQKAADYLLNVQR